MCTEKTPYYGGGIKTMEDRKYQRSIENIGTGAAETVDASRTFFNRVYNWMASGLALTGIVAWFAASNKELMNWSCSSGGTLLLVLLTFGLVIALNFALNKISAPVAALLYVCYAVLNGLLFSAIFLVYTSSTIYMAFFTTAGVFAITSFFGYLTRMNLSSIGGFAFMGLIGIIIATLVNLFLRSEGLYWILTYATVLIFIALTAWDTQKLKRLADGMNEEGVYSEDGKKLAIVGALALYLDFINLFLMILRIFGGRNK